MMVYLQLFLEFMKIGAFTFGGGYAMLPLIESTVLRHGWLTRRQLVDFIAVSESTPGPLAVNLSTYIGQRTGGFPGAFCATLGIVVPSFVIILILAKCYEKFQRNRVVNGCLAGIRPAVAGLIGAAVFSVGSSVFAVQLESFRGFFRQMAAKQNLSMLVILLAAMGMSYRKLHPVIIICVSGILGIACGYMGGINGF